MTVTILVGNSLDVLRELPSESVQMVCTSPPYWGLRSYLPAGHPDKALEQGLEATPAEFVARMVEVFREVRRVLRHDGVCFVNLGDSYAGSWGAQSRGADCAGGLEGGSTLSARQIEAHPRGQKNTGSLKRTPGLKNKDLVGIPWRVAFALQDDGWYLRGDYIWGKPNPMPESVADRCTKAHEYIFHLSKSERYFWDQEAIRERADFGFPNSPESIASPYGQGFTRRASSMDQSAVPPGEKLQTGMGRKTVKRDDGSLSRNKRSVWTVATTPFPEAHFATFPVEIPTICIKAGSRPGDTVLDPFSGAGTTALVADRLQRNAIGIELNPEYAEMSRNRIDRDRGGLLDVMEATQ